MASFRLLTVRFPISKMLFYVSGVNNDLTILDVKNKAAILKTPLNFHNFLVTVYLLNTIFLGISVAETHCKKHCKQVYFLDMLATFISHFLSSPLCMQRM